MSVYLLSVYISFSIIWRSQAPLPRGWEIYKDAGGEPFYYQRKTGVTSYRHPADEYFINKVRYLLYFFMLQGCCVVFFLIHTSARPSFVIMVPAGTLVWLVVAVLTKLN